MISGYVYYPIKLMKQRSIYRVTEEEDMETNYKLQVHYNAFRGMYYIGISNDNSYKDFPTKQEAIEYLQKINQ